MLDAHPAPAAPVRAPAASVPTATTAYLCGPQHEPRSKPGLPPISGPALKLEFGAG